MCNTLRMSARLFVLSCVTAIAPLGACSNVEILDADAGASDGGGRSDGAAEPDTGEPRDAAVDHDAETGDSGHSDAGHSDTGGGEDSGTAGDAGTQYDTGSTDTGATTDAGGTTDAGTATDAGADAGQGCTGNGKACAIDAECCAGTCSNSVCGTGQNLPDGAACTSGGQCCQGSCWKEVCGLPPAPSGTWPWLPGSCQGLRNRSHGSCVDTYADPNYGSIPWEFKDAVGQAIGTVGEPTGLFDAGNVYPEKRGEYAALVAGALDGLGLCAVWDGGELYVRDGTMDYNETYSLFTGSGRPRAGGHWKCEPSDNIPGTHPALPCNSPPSENPSCGASGKNYFDDVVAMVEEVIAEEQALGGQSRIIDFNFKSGHVRGWRLKDDGYPFVARMAVKATAWGYCVQSSGWKWIAIKKDNAMSETYSLVTHVNLPDPVTKPDLYAACACDGLLPSCEHIIEKGEETCTPAGF